MCNTGCCGENRSVITQHTSTCSMSIQMYRCTVDLTVREEACNNLWNVQLNDVFFGLRYVLLRQECLPNGRKSIQTSSQLRVLRCQRPYFVPCKKTQVGVNHGSNCARPELRSTCKDLRNKRLLDQSSLLVTATEGTTKHPQHTVVLVVIV